MLPLLRDYDWNVCEENLMHCYEFLLDLMNMTVALNSVKSNDYTPRIAKIYI